MGRAGSQKTFGGVISRLPVCDLGQRQCITLGRGGCGVDAVVQAVQVVQRGAFINRGFRAGSKATCFTVLVNEEFCAIGVGGLDEFFFQLGGYISKLFLLVFR